jgi:hypothetical protein
MENTHQVLLVKALLQIHTTRIEEYQNGYTTTLEDDLKIIFYQFMKTSQRCKSELVQELLLLTGKYEDKQEEKVSDANIWLDVKIAITTSNRHLLITLINQIEETLVIDYKLALKDNVEQITLEQQTMIREQSYLLKSNKLLLSNCSNLLVKA